MGNGIITRSDYIKILTKTILVGVISSLGVMTLTTIVSQVEFSPHNLETLNLLIQVLILLFLSILPTVIGNILNEFKAISINNHLEMLGILLSKIFNSLTIIFAVFYFQFRGKNDLPSFGFIPTSNILRTDIIITSLLFFLLISIVLGLFQRFDLGESINLTNIDLSNENLTLFKTTYQRLLATVMVFFQVVSEEVLTRGYLVLYLGRSLGHPIVFGLIAIIIITISHLHQGKEKVMYHLMYSLIMIGSVLLSGHIFLSLTIHLLINYSYSFSIWKIKREDS